MAENARLAYLQARLQARHGDRPKADDWRLVEASAELSHYLDAVRRTALKRWVGDINQDMAPEAIERTLRTTWRETVDQVASWSPSAWRDAVRWLRWLPDLPAIEHLMRGAKVPPWMRADPVMRELAFDEPQRRREALAALPLAPMHPGEAPAGDIAAGARRSISEAWIRGWRRRLPPGNGTRAELEAILEMIHQHFEAMRSSEAADGKALRNALAARLQRRFRRGAGTAVALFSHLALDGLELERVRAGVMTRRMLPERAEGRSWA
jgi:hypothetical protein